jgi:hypothetical protein
LPGQQPRPDNTLPATPPGAITKPGGDKPPIEIDPSAKLGEYVALPPNFVVTPPSGEKFPAHKADHPIVLPDGFVLVPPPGTKLPHEWELKPKSRPVLPHGTEIVLPHGMKLPAAKPGQSIALPPGTKLMIPKPKHHHK